MLYDNVRAIHFCGIRNVFDKITHELLGVVIPTKIKETILPEKIIALHFLRFKRRACPFDISSNLREGGNAPRARERESRRPAGKVLTRSFQVPSSL